MHNVMNISRKIRLLYTHAHTISLPDYNLICINNPAFSQSSSTPEFELCISVSLPLPLAVFEDVDQGRHDGFLVDVQVDEVGRGFLGDVDGVGDLGAACAGRS
jgi:hypothetical protein